MIHQIFKDWAIQCVANHHTEISRYLLDNVRLDVYTDEFGENVELYDYESSVESIAQFLADEQYPGVEGIYDAEYDALVGVLYDEIQDVFPEDEVREIVLRNYDEEKEFNQAKLSARRGNY